MKYIKLTSYILSALMLTLVLGIGVLADDDFVLSKDYISSTGDRGVLYNSPEEKLATMGILDGKITVESQEGVGTSFSVSFTKENKNV